jgi:hypothetical protein
MTKMLLVSLLVFTACGKKEDKSAAGGDKPAKATEPAAAPAGGPVKTDPKALFAEFTTPGGDPMKLLDKYREGATFSGKVSVKGAEETGKPILWMELDGGKHISLDYTDVGKAKAVKDGDTITVTCKIGGADGKLMMVNDCN